MVKVRIIDVAQKAGVSKSTVSQFLNKRYEFMSEETRKRIAQAIKELGFQPNAIARSLKMKKTNTVGVIVANILHPFSTAVSRGVEDYCQKHGYNVILCNADDNPNKERAYIHMLQMKQVDGIIIASTGANNELLKQEIDRGFPVVLFDRRFDDLETDMVYSDNRKGAYMAIEHLIQLGHKRIALVAPAGPLLSVRSERLEGYHEALKKYGIPADEHLIKFLSKTNTYTELESLWSMQNPPTAVFTINDLMAMEVLTYFKQKLVRIPEDIAMIGFDDFPTAHLLASPLTVVAQPTYDIGVRSAELLIKHIENEDKQSLKYVQHIFPCQLMIRESCGFRKKNGQS
ncbi:MAG: LacI family transcriptional regulator, kdg operon repressor [Clostridiales bacterium]|jgi:LacI family kdg operon repressor|nr:LacI family transcriptional regulator, kdg operon repressor [Clostridiales bacterium]MDK2933210.1 LacI family transcriptional regulator, kdg operon repressor [Clostridiales bacterium]